MKYLLLIYAAETELAEGVRTKCMADSTKLCHELASRGQFVDASPLQSVATATSVRVRGGNRLITDGPFAETTEQLGGYFLIDVANLDEAIAIAGRIPAATWGTVEVRPLNEVSGLPQTK